MLRDHASDPGLDDLPQLQQAHFGEREEVSVLWGMATGALWLGAGAPEADRAPARSHRADRERLRRPLRGLAGPPARGDPAPGGAVRDPLARLARAVAARHDW